MKGKIIGAVLGLLIVAAIAAIAKNGEPARQSAPREPERSSMLQNYRISTRACMEDGVLALREIGERDEAAINTWAVKQCGYKLTNYFVNYLDRPSPEAEVYMRAFVAHEVASLVGHSP